MSAAFCVIFGIIYDLFGRLMSIASRFICHVKSLLQLYWMYPIVFPRLFPVIICFYGLEGKMRSEVFSGTNRELPLFYLRTRICYRFPGGLLSCFIQSAKTSIESIGKDMLSTNRVPGRSEWNIFFAVIILLSWRGRVLQNEAISRRASDPVK